jgi:formylglycine-generating enzyme required for sulfatase activity
MSLRINRRNNFLEIKEGSNLKIFKALPKYLKSEIPDHDFPYHLGYCGDTNYGLYSEPSLHHNQDTSFLTSSAVKFDGNEFLETNEISLTNKNNFSISTWIKTSSNLEEVLITDMSYQNSGSFQLKSNNQNNRPEFSVFDGVSFISVTGHSGINDNDWHFLNVNFSCDQATKNSSIEMYIDSELQNSKSITGFIDLENITASGSFSSRENELYKLFDKNNSTYIEMSGSQEESDFYFANPITGGIDKIRYRAINDSAAYGEVKASLILKDKITEEVSTFDFQSFISSNFDSNKGVSNSSTIAKTQTPVPNAIPESGISYGPVDSIFSTGCPTDCSYFDLRGKKWFPLQEYDINYNHESLYNRGFYPLRPQDEIDYETDSAGNIIEHEPKYTYANFNTWQTDTPFLYGRDWDAPQFLDKDIIGFRYKYSPSTTENQTFGMDFSRIIEFGLYLRGNEYSLLETLPLNSFEGLTSNHNESFNLTIGSTASSNKTNFFNGSVDQILLLDKTLTQDDINSFYSERDSIEYSAQLADELKVISWYDFSNTNIIGWDRHNKVTTQELVRLYNFNNTRNDSSSYSVNPELFGSLNFSTETVNFPGYAAFFNGSSYLFDPGGREMDFQSNLTIECFLNFSTIPEDDQQTILSSKNFQVSNTSFEYYFKNDKMYFDIYQLDQKIITVESETLNISTDKYYHIAVCRNRNTINLFFNQSLCGTAELPFYVPISDPENGIYILNGFHGYVQDLRIIQDSAIYEPNLYIDDFYKRLDNQFVERHNLYTTSHYPLQESVTMSDSRGIYIPQGHYLETAHEHKAFNFHKNSFSICLWFRLENLNKSGFILGSWNDEGGYSHSYALRYVKNFRNQVNTLVFLASEDGTNFRSVKTAKLENNIISPESWYFVSITYNGNDKSLNMYLYSDSEFIDSTSMKVNSFFTIPRRDDFQINGVKHTESSNTFLDLSLSQLFFSYRTFSFIDVQKFWNSGVGITYDENNINFNRDLIAWFDFSEGSINDINGNKHLSSSTTFSIVEGRKKLELIDDGSEIFLGKMPGGSNLLFNMSGNRAIYKTSGINSLPSIEFNKDSLSFLDSNFELDFTSSFTLYFCFQSLGNNNDFAPIVDFSNSESEGLSILWKDTPDQNYLGELKLLINGEELILKEGNFIRNTNVVSLEWNVHKEKLFLTINNSRLSSAPRALTKTGLQTNFAKTPLSLGKFYYDFNNELITFNGLLSELILNKNYSDPKILEYFSCKYNAIHPGYPVDYIYDDDNPSMLFDLSELKQTIGEGSTSLGRLKCDLQNPIFSIVDSEDFTINEDGYIALTSPADREIDSYTFTILVEDEDSDLSETISFISYVQIDNIIAIINDSNLVKYVSSENKSAGKNLGRVSTTEPVDWSIFSSSSASVSIDSLGNIELAEDIPDGETTFSFTISATDYQDNITSTTHTVEIVDLEGHTEIEFIPTYNNYLDIETIVLPNSAWIEFETEGESDIFEIKTSSLFNSNGLQVLQQYSTIDKREETHSLSDFFYDETLTYKTALSPTTSLNPEHSYIDSETLNNKSTETNPTSYDQYYSGVIDLFNESDTTPSAADFTKPTELTTHLLNNKFTADQAPISTYFDSSIIENPELSACKKVVDNLKYIADGNPYSVDPPDFDIGRNAHYKIRINTSYNQRNKPCKIRLKTVGLTIISSYSATAPDIKVKADEKSFLQHLSFGGPGLQTNINKLTLDCETDQLISLRYFLRAASSCNEIEKINFNTKNVITLFEAFSYINTNNESINNSIKNFLNSLSFENLIVATNCFRSSRFTGSNDLNLSSWNTWNLQKIDSMFENAEFYEGGLLFSSQDIDSIDMPRHYGSSSEFDDVNPDSFLPNDSYITYFSGIMNSTFYTKKIRSARSCFQNILISSQDRFSTNLNQQYRIEEVIDYPTKNKNGTDYRVAFMSSQHGRFVRYIRNSINNEYQELGNIDCLLNTELNLNCFELDLCCASRNMFYNTKVEKIKIKNLNFTRKFDLSYFFYNSEFLRFIELPDATPIKPSESLAYSITNMFGNCYFLENLGLKTLEGKYAQFENHKSFIDGFSFFNLDYCVNGSAAFSNCKSITNISIPRFTNILDLSNFAYGCLGVSKIEGFATHSENNPKIVYLSKKADGEFDGMTESEEVDWLIENNLHLQTCNTKNLLSLKYAFYNCGQIQKLVFTGLSTNKIKDFSYTFGNCEKLREIRIGLEYHTNNYRNEIITTDRYNIQQYWENKAEVPAESINFVGSFGSSKGNVKINGKGDVYAESIGGSEVKVFQYNESLNQWDQKGETISPPSNSYNKFGHAIEIDESGDRIIISDFPEPSSAGAGYAQIFEWSGGSWGQLGDTIVSEENSNDTFGADVSISKDGNIIAVSTEGDALTRNASHQVEFEVLTFTNQPGGFLTIYLSETYSSYTTFVIEFSQPETDPTITQNGTTLTLNFPYNNYGVYYPYISDIINWLNLQPGISAEASSTVNLNNSGLEQSESGQTAYISPITLTKGTKIFSLEDSNWVQLGETISAGQSINLNHNGSIISIGDPEYNTDTANNVGRVEVFEFDSGAWIKLGSTIVGPDTSPILTKTVANIATTDGGASEDPARVIELDLTEEYLNVENFSLNFYQNASEAVLSNGGLDLAINLDFSAADVNEDFFFTIPVQRRESGPQWWGPNYVYQRGGAITVSGAGLNVNTTFTLTFTAAGTPATFDHDIDNNTVTLTYPRFSSNQTFRVWTTGGGSTYLSMGTDPSVISLVNFINNQSGFSATTTAATSFENRSPPGTLQGTYNSTYSGEGQGPYVEQFVNWINNSVENISARITVPYDSETNSGIELDQFLRPQDRSDIVKSYTDADDNRFGYNDINFNGNRVIVGATHSNTEVGEDSGLVKIFDYNGTEWTQVGTTINGHESLAKEGLVSINKVGNIIITGGINKRNFRIFKEINSEWVEQHSESHIISSTKEVSVDMDYSGDNTISIQSSDAVVRTRKEREIQIYNVNGFFDTRECRDFSSMFQSCLMLNHFGGKLVYNSTASSPDDVFGIIEDKIFDSLAFNYKSAVRMDRMFFNVFKDFVSDFVDALESLKRSFAIYGSRTYYIENTEMFPIETIQEIEELIYIFFNLSDPSDLPIKNTATSLFYSSLGIESLASTKRIYSAINAGQTNNIVGWTVEADADTILSDDEIPSTITDNSINTALSVYYDSLAPFFAENDTYSFVPEHKSFFLNFNDREIDSEISLGGIFYNSQNIENVVFLKNPNFKNKINNISSSFFDCRRLRDFIDLRGFDFNTLQTTNNFARNCYHIKYIFFDDTFLSEGNTTSDISFMFYNCFLLQSVNTENWIGNNLYTMAHVFANCHSIEVINFSKLNPEKCLLFNNAFEECNSINELNLNNFSTTSGISFNYMFQNVGAAYPAWEFIYEEYGPPGSAGTVSTEQPDLDYAEGVNAYLLNNYVRDESGNIIPPSSAIDFQFYRNQVYGNWYSLYYGSLNSYYYQQDGFLYIVLDFLRDNFYREAQLTMPTQEEYTMYIDRKWDYSEGLDSLDLTSFDISNAYQADRSPYNTRSTSHLVSTRYRGLFEDKYLPQLLGNSRHWNPDLVNAYSYVSLFLKHKALNNNFYFEKINDSDHPFDYMDQMFQEYEKAYEIDPTPSLAYSLSSPLYPFYTNYNNGLSGGITGMFKGLTINTLTIPENFKINNHSKKFANVDLSSGTASLMKDIMETKSSKLFYSENEILDFVNNSNWDPTNSTTFNNPLYGDFVIALSPSCKELFFRIRVNELNISNEFLESLSATRDISGLFSSACCRNFNENWALKPSEFNRSSYVSGGAIKTNLTDFSKIDTSSALIFTSAFGEAMLENLDLSTLNTNNAFDLTYTFARWDLSLNPLVLSSMDTSNVRSMVGTFSYIKDLSSLTTVPNSVDLSFLNFKKVVNIGEIFRMTHVNIITMPTSRHLFKTSADTNLFNISYAFNGDQTKYSPNEAFHFNNIKEMFDKINLFIRNICLGDTSDLTSLSNLFDRRFPRLSFNHRPIHGRLTSLNENQSDYNSIVDPNYTSRQDFLDNESEYNYRAFGPVFFFDDDLTDLSNQDYILDVTPLDMGGFRQNNIQQDWRYMFSDIAVKGIKGINEINFDVRKLESYGTYRLSNMFQFYLYHSFTNYRTYPSAATNGFVGSVGSINEVLLHAIDISHWCTEGTSEPSRFVYGMSAITKEVVLIDYNTSPPSEYVTFRAPDWGLACNINLEYTISNITPGSRVQVYNLTQTYEVYNDIVNANSLVDYFTQNEIQEGDKIRVRVTYVNGTSANQPIELIEEIQYPGLNISLDTSSSTIYNAIAIDGSSVAEFEAVNYSQSNKPPIIEINDTNNETFVNRFIAWYFNEITTENGISYLYNAFIIKSVNQVIINPDNNFYSSWYYGKFIGATKFNNTKLDTLYFKNGSIYPSDGSSPKTEDSNEIIFDDFIIDLSAKDGSYAGLDVEFVLVETGSFEANVSTDCIDCLGSETTQEVLITEEFYIAKTEVTQSQYELITRNNNLGLSTNPSQYTGPNLPVEQVSWDNVQDFFTILNTEYLDILPIGWSFSLPSEAEWEFAGRGGVNSGYYWGDTIDSSKANYNWDGGQNDGSDTNKTVDVSTFAPNPLGLLDIHGNVSEWVLDPFQMQYPGTSTKDPNDYPYGVAIDPFSFANSDERIIKGGAWNDGADALKFAYRSKALKNAKSRSLGFRIAIRKSPLVLFNRDTFIVVTFDTSGSMSGAEPQIRAALSGGYFKQGSTTERNPESVRAVLQDYYATGGTEFEGNTNPATNGRDEYDAKVRFIEDPSERHWEYIRNSKGTGLGVGVGDDFEGAKAIISLAFQDESSPYGNSATNTQSQQDVSNLKAEILALPNSVLFFGHAFHVTGTAAFKTYLQDIQNGKSGLSSNFTFQDEPWNEMIGFSYDLNENESTLFFRNKILEAIEDKGYQLPDLF